jgi:GDP-4-dehydro-6-deoxy-D-mannose reductase
MTGRALVTGALGFVGSALCAHLKRQGWELVRTDLDDAVGHRDFLSCDLTRPEQIESLLERAGDLTHLFHLAARTFVPESIEDPAGTLDANLQAVIHLGSSAQRITPGIRFVFASTSEIYGPPASTPVTEDHPFNPQNPYAITKAAADHYCRYLAETDGADVVRLRLFNHSGPGQSGRFVLSSFARQIADIEAGRAAPVLRVGNLEARRDFTHVDDVLRAYEAAALGSATGEAYNICSGESHSMQEALDILLDLSTVAVTVEVDPERLRPSDIPEICGSYEKFAAATGWNPTKSFDEIMEDLLGYWRQPKHPD